MLAAKGIEIRVVQDRTRGVRHHPRRPEMVSKVVGHISGRIPSRNALPPKEDVVNGVVPRRIRLGDGVAARTVPVELAVRLLHAAVVAVVGVIHSGGALHPALCVPGVAEAAVASQVARRIVGKAGVVDLVLRGDAHTERQRAALGHRLREQVGPDVVPEAQRQVVEAVAADFAAAPPRCTLRRGSGC